MSGRKTPKGRSAALDSSKLILFLVNKALNAFLNGELVDKLSTMQGDYNASVNCSEKWPSEDPYVILIPVNKLIISFLFMLEKAAGMSLVLMNS